MHRAEVPLAAPPQDSTRTSYSKHSTAPLLQCQPDGIPRELLPAQQWVNFRTRPKRNEKLDKIPLDPKPSARLRNAKVDDADTWGTFEQAVANLDQPSVAGIGFVLTADDPYAAIDLDDCVDPITGAISAEAWAIVETFRSYTERSPSGRGLRILLRGVLPSGARNRKDWIEVYDRGRFVTLTGVHL
jgi:primase-polymerase (primpol)-like protein